MPIRPDNRARYPKDWPAISMAVRQRAEQRCETCGVANYALGSWVRGVWWEAGPKGSGLHDQPKQGGRFPCFPPDNEPPEWHTVKRVILTVAHMDHQPENCDPSNLKALCQRCHNLYDAAHRRAGIRARARAAQADADLFPSPLAERKET